MGEVMEKSAFLMRNLIRPDADMSKAYPKGALPPSLMFPLKSPIGK